MIDRREVFTLLGGAAAGWPMVARAQQGERLLRVGVLIPYAEDDPQAQERVGAFRKALRERGWIEGSNLLIDYRWAGPDLSIKGPALAAELVGLKPDVILANGGVTVAPLLKHTRNIPIVFVNFIDPVGAGFVESLSHPGGNITGFTPFEYGISGKWIELLKEIAPGVTRAGVLRNPAAPGAGGQLGAIQSVAPSFGVAIRPIGVNEAKEIERLIATFAQTPSGGLIVSLTPQTVAHRGLIIRLAERHKLPAVYPARVFIADGGLLSYGPDPVEPFPRAAAYVDRILKGEKPANLPVQAPTKYELVINLKTANALGLTVPSTLLARADEVIE